MSPVSSPFKFLDSYTREDREIFFGRDREIEELYQKVFDAKILLLYGVSGTGKTSLINCGLANKFEDSDWLPVNIRRGTDINKSLESDLRKAALTPLKKGAGLVEALHSIYLDQFKPLYLIFDQFEELFIFGDRRERDEFISNIKELAESDVQCRLIFSIREEYLAGVTEFESQIPDFLVNRMRVEKITRKHAIEVIEGPCRVHNIEVDKAFPESLLDKLNPDKNEIELTYLQVLLDKIYRLSGDSSKFGLNLLDQAGDVSDLLGSFLEEQINELEDSETGLIVLKAFVSMQGTKKQIGEEEIQDFSRTLGKPVEADALTDLLQKFINLRLLRDKDDNDKYELRHDSLATKIFEKITLVEKELLEIKLFIENAYHHFEKRGVYLGGGDLKYIAPYEDKLFLNRSIESFIHDSKRILGRARRRRRNLVAISGTILIFILAGFTVWALSERRTSIHQKNEAIQARDEADKSRLSADKSRDEAEIAKNDALRQQSMTDSALVIAEQERKIAQFQKQDADQQRHRAESLLEETNEQRKIAEESRNQAEKLAEDIMKSSREAMLQLYLFNANEFANKSLLMERNDTLKALLAMSAYDLFKFGYENYSDDNTEILFDIQIIEALQKAYSEFLPNSIISGEIWAIDLNKDLIAISNRGNELIFINLNDRDSGNSAFHIMDSSYLDYIIDRKYRIDYSINRSLIRTISFDELKPRLVCGANDGNVFLVELGSNNKVIHVEKIYSHNSRIITLKKLDLNDLVVSSSNDSSFVLWDIANKQSLFNLKLNYKITQILDMGDGVLLLKGSNGILFTLNYLEKDPVPQAFFTNDIPIDLVAVNRHVNRLAAVCPGEVILIDIREMFTSKLVNHRYDIPNYGMNYTMEYSPDGNWLVLGTLDGTVLLLDLSDIRIEGDDVINPIIISNPFQKIISTSICRESKFLFYNDMRNLIVYPISYMNAYDQLVNILKGRRISKDEWETYARGNISNPRN